MKQKVQYPDFTEQLKAYKTRYNKTLMACLNSDHLSEKMFLSGEFPMQVIYEFIELYEEKYPERKQAFKKFFRRNDNGFSHHMAKIKCMSYMLDEKTVVRMSELMNKRNGIYMQLFSESNPVPHGASAYFGRDFWGRPRIMYYEIDSKSRLHPPYKTFFHEFGHALDSLMVRGSGFLSDRFRCTKQAEYKELSYDHSVNQICVNRVKTVYTKTIHEWAELDVQNDIIQAAMDLFQGRISGNSHRRYLNPTISSLKKYYIIDYTVHHLFLKSDGCEQLAGLSGKLYFEEISDLYHDVREVMNKTIFANYKNMIVLPKDLFGGITNNQLGGGHGSDYWFKGNRRINKVSREAFAGYFEYKTTITDSVFQKHLINPYQCMPNTEAALGAMLGVVLRK